MFLCYVDESGDAGTLNPGNPTDTPVFVAAALIVDQARLAAITRELLALKQRFFPSAALARHLDSILHEVKGETLRKALRRAARRNWSHAVGYLDHIMDIADRHGVKLLAKALVKAVGASNSDAGFYGAAMMHICGHFQAFLAQQGNGARGHVIADSRRKAQNTQVAHTIFTQMFQAAGNRYPGLVEMPTYGHSDNHAMLQMADTICSAVLFPMLTDAFCGGLDNVHVSPRFASVRGRYRDVVQAMQYRYQHNGRWSGGILVTDATGERRNASLLFR